MSRTRFTRTVAVVAVATITLATPLQSQEVGVNSAVRNNVNVKQNAAASGQQARVHQRVAIGNEVSTGAASALQVTLLDRSSLTIGPNAKLTVNRFVYDPARRQGAVAATVAKGTFRFLSGRGAQPGSNSINTPAASIGIRGTMIEGAVGPDAIAMARLQPRLSLPAGTDPQTATMVVLRGPGPGAPKGVQQGQISVTSGGRTVVISRPGQAAFVPAPGMAPMGPFQITPGAYQSFDIMLRTAPQTFTSVMLQVRAQAQPGSNAARQARQNRAGNSGNSSGSAGSSGSTGTGSGTGGSGGGGSGTLIALGIGGLAGGGALLGALGGSSKSN